MLLKALAERSATRSFASRFTSVSGLFYVGMGLVICVAPTLVAALFFEPSLAGREAGLFRLVGWVMAVVGWFLWIGGRTGATSFVAAGIVARLGVPLVAVPLALGGVLPHMLWVFALLDPLSGVLTWRLLAKG